MAIGRWPTNRPRTSRRGSFVSHPDLDSRGVKAVIQRIDGDTGSLYGVWNGKNYTSLPLHCRRAAALYHYAAA